MPARKAATSSRAGPGETALLQIRFGKMKSDAISYQLITFARRFLQAVPIKYRHLPSTMFNQARKFKFANDMRDGWPMRAEHFGKEVLRDQECIPVNPVVHH